MMSITLEMVEAAIDDLNAMTERFPVDSDDSLEALGIEDIDLFRTYCVNKAIEACRSMLPGFPVEDYADLTTIADRMPPRDIEPLVRLLSMVSACWMEGFAAAVQMYNNLNDKEA